MHDILMTEGDSIMELTMVAERNLAVGKAVVRLRELSADERARDLFERRGKGTTGSSYEGKMGCETRQA